MLYLILDLVIFVLYVVTSIYLTKKINFDLKLTKDEKKNNKNIYGIVTIFAIIIVITNAFLNNKDSNISFDSDYIINYYIKLFKNGEPIALEGAIGLIIFLIFFINLCIIPIILKKKSKLTKKKFLKDYYKKGYKTLPIAKLENCVYKRGCYTTEDISQELIELFDELYISKKVYIDSNSNDNYSISKRVLNFEQELIEPLLVETDREYQDAIVLGDAGCGKTTLLLHTFIDMLSNSKQNKILPVFIDLKNVSKDNTITQEIKKTLLKVYQSSFDYKYRFILELNDESEQDMTLILKELNKEGYKVIILADSLDECVIIDDLLTANEKINLGIKYKLVVALRNSAYDRFDELLNQYLNNPIVYMVRDYDKSEVNLYIEKLVGQKQFTEEIADKIIRNIELVTFDEKVNPFIVSMIVNGYIRELEYSHDFISSGNDKNLIIEILTKNIRGLIKDVNISKKNIEQFHYNQMTYELIGIYTVFKNVFPNMTVEDYSRYSHNGQAYLDYIDDVRILKSHTYLVDNKGQFYQKIFGDFYAAQYIINTFDQNSELSKKILFEVFSSNKYTELIEYLILVSDYNYNDIEKSNLNIMLEYVFNNQNISSEQIYDKIKIMLLAINKYSTKKIVKDQKPMEIKAIRNANKVITWLYTKYFQYLIDKQEEIDYDYFYSIISIIDKHDLVAHAILNLEHIHQQQIFKMLSILRDSYLNLNYQHKPILFFDCFNFSVEKQKKILSVSTNNQSIENMNLRELLNYSFYNSSLIKKEQVSIDLKKRYFPTIYNLDLFIDSYEEQKGNITTLVTEEDNLLFDSNKQYKSILMLNADLLNKNSMKVDKNIISIFIFSDNTNILYDKLNNTDNVRSIDINNKITILGENAFNKSINLKNIILPLTLKEIRDFAIYECHRIEEIYIPETVEVLGESFVEDCFSLTSVTLPKNLKSLGNFAFEGDSALTEINFNNCDISLPIGALKGCLSITNFEALFISKNIKSLPKQLFNGCKNIKKIDLSEYTNLKTIENSTFAKCKNLEEVILPYSLNNIGMLAFYECDNLKTVTFNSIPTISKQLFAGLNHEITINVNINNVIKTRKISKNDEFNKFLISLGAKTIDDKFVNRILFERENEGYRLEYSFNSELKDFKTSDYPNVEIKTCSLGALGDHDLLNDVIFDENLEAMSDWLFEDCYSLYVVDLSKSKIQTLNKHVFENCYGLSEVIVPSSLTIIDDYAFENCNSLNKIVYDEKCKNKTLLISKQISKVGFCAFHNCIEFNKIIIESNETVIETFAFFNLENVKEIVLPENYDPSKIKNQAFVNLSEQVKITGYNISIEEKKRILN